jgi:hypothetical protein
MVRGIHADDSWNTLVRRLVEGGFVETFEAKVEGEPTTCIRLLRPYSEDILEEDEQEEEGIAAVPLMLLRRADERNEFIEHKPDLAGMVAELPIDQQLYNRIEETGTEGLLQFQLYVIIILISWRL